MLPVNIFRDYPILYYLIELMTLDPSTYQHLLQKLCSIVLQTPNHFVKWYN